MRRFFGKVKNDIAVLDGDEFIHLRTVLRAKEGDKVIIYDKSEMEYVCEIIELSKTQAKCKVLSSKICDGLPKKNIVLFQALTKRDAFELSLQKAVELGIAKMIPFTSDFTNVKSTENKRERLEKLVLSACKQCERCVPMQIGDTLSFNSLIEEVKEFNSLENSVVLFANERAGEKFDFSSLREKKNIAIIVGAEGGFSQKEKKELELLSTSISLGRRILRNETASIVLCGIVSILGDN